MKHFFILFAVLLVHSSNTHAQDSIQTGLLYGHNNAYYLTAPGGWVMDTESGKEDGLTAVFYPKGGTWADAETVMYTTFTNFDTTKKESISDVIRHDSMAFKANSPLLSIKKQKPISISKTKKALVYSFAGDANGNYEEVAYIPEKKGVVMIIISSRNKNGCINHHKSFASLVRSYKFLTDNVNIKIGE